MRHPPPPQGEARSGRVPMQNASAFCMGPGGGLGLPMKKADAFFMGTQGGGEQSLMNQNSCFSIDCCPHPNPSLLLRKQYLSLRERYVSQRDKHCSRSERGARSLDCQHALKPHTALRALAQRNHHQPTGSWWCENAHLSVVLCFFTL